MARLLALVEGAGGDENALLGEPGDGVEGGLVARAPQVQPRFGVVDAQARGAHGCGEGIPSGAIALLLLGDVDVVAEGGDHGRLHGRGRHKAGMLAHLQDAAHELLVAGEERGAIAGEVRLLAERVDAEHAGRRAVSDDARVQEILSLVETLDAHVPVPDRDYDAPFFMPVEGVCSIEGLGTVITGKVERGRLAVGASVEVVGRGGEPRTAFVKGIQSFHRDVPEAVAGWNVGLLLRGVGRDEIVRGQVAVEPGSIASHALGEAEIFLLHEKEGGRKRPFGSGYAPQLFFGVVGVTGVLRFDEGVIAPGDRASVRFELDKAVAIEPGMRFAMREGGRTIGAGVVRSVA